MGNAKVERAKLSPGFIPMGMKEYGGIVYIASYNPDTLECEVGSFPSPERDITGNNDIENQTGLVDGNFETSDYKTSVRKVLEEFEPSEILTKLQKLNEEEILKLNPGDKFITTFQVGEVTGPGEPITNSNFQDFFAWGNSDKKIFHINFYKIDDSNNIVKFQNGVKLIPYRNDIEEDEFDYYTQSSSGSIAVEASINQLNYFNSEMRELSRPGEVLKKIRIQAIGESDSKIKFEGVRVDLKSVSESNVELFKSFHLKNDGNSDKVSVTVKDFNEGDEVTCQVTPYNQYGYSPTLSQISSLKIGQGVTTGNITDVFKWNVDLLNKRLELDFDFKLQSTSNLKMYIEFYDVWSNVSTIRTVNSPSVYGTMRLILPLVNEPRTNVFDPYDVTTPTKNEDHQLGGISFKNLTVNTSVINAANLCNTSVYGADIKRDDNSLRMNHFYLVRICGYEEIDDDGVVKTNTYDSYKALYTNTIFNELYDQQRNVPVTDISYRGDFTLVPYPLEKIGYSGEVVSDGSPLNYSIHSEIPDPATVSTVVNGVAYPFGIDERTSIPNGKLMRHITKYNVTKNYTVSLKRPEEYIFGSLEDNVLQINGGSGSVEIQDSDVGSAELAMQSQGSLIIPSFSNPGSYPITLSILTNRGVEGTVRYASFTGKIQKVSLLNLMHNAAVSTIKNFECDGHKYQASLSMYRTGAGDNRRSPCENLRKSGAIVLRVNPSDSSSTEQGVKSSSGGDRTAVTKMAILDSDGYIDKQFFSVFNFDGRMHVDNYQNVQKNTRRMMFVQRGANEDIIQIPMSNASNTTINTTMTSFLSKVFFYKSDNTASSLGYYITQPITQYFNSNHTLVNKVVLDIISNWINPSTKTYVFNTLLKSISNSTNTKFNTTNVNTIVNNSILKSNATQVIVDSIPDSRFIPYLDQTTAYEPVNINLQLNKDPLIISKASNPDVVNAYSNSESKYRDEELNLTTNRSNKLQTSIVNPSADVSRFLDAFTYNEISNQLEWVGGTLSLTGQYYYQYKDIGKTVGSTKVITSELNLQ